MPRALRGQCDAARSLHVDHAASGHVPFEGARSLFLDLGPRALGNGSQLAMEVVHEGSPLREPIPSEPSLARASRGDGSPLAVGWAPLSSAMESKKVDEGTKNRFPVVARLKSRSRS